jgi:CRP/FNR family transcriptional regulator, cyclic AMP receptor protein
MVSSINRIFTSSTPQVHRRIEAKEFGLFFDNIEEEFYPASTILFTPEESGEKLYILSQGRVDLFRITSSGKRLVTRRIIPGGVFGDMGLLGQTMQGNYAVAVENSLIGIVTREDILAVLRLRPEVSLRLLEVVGNRLRQIEERLVEATYSPVRVRIAHFLLSNADLISGVITSLTHEEIGDIVGAARQTVTETLNILQNQGVIMVEPKKIRIIDRRRLEIIFNA